ncbi:MAG TPA: protein kinase [Gemmataceae bacterium]|jgi:tetratricopeptide (TPR) repeat protein/tRNA A-37 threonylcarbamoyl transferase component Bud32|nr:protein kinase [Gemmataceae bacterium]
MPTSRDDDDSDQTTTNALDSSEANALPSRSAARRAPTRLDQTYIDIDGEDEHVGDGKGDKSTVHETTPDATVFFAPPANGLLAPKENGGRTEYIKPTPPDNPPQNRGEETIAPGELNSLNPVGSGTYVPEWPGVPTEVMGASILEQPGQFDSAATGAWSTVQPKSSEAPTGAPPIIEQGYEILGELGRGGMGVVYKARQRGIKRVVALKMILAGQHTRQEDLLRFRIEAEAVARLRHPNIVQLYEVGELDGQPYFSLEYVDGGSLAAAIDGTPQPTRKAAETALQLAEAMAYAHQNGILHRDLKPANVLLTGEGVLKITDFGLAKQMEDQDSSRTQEGSVMGSPSYMAPEQAEGKISQLGPQADVYSIGAILYELLTGRPPFRGETLLETLSMVKHVEPVPPSRLHAKIPRDLETICLKCLEKLPIRRYLGASDLAEDLRRFLAGEPIKARPTPAWERAWKWSKRRPALVGLLGVSVAAAVGLVALIIWHNASLREQLIQAREEERLARQGEQEAIEAERFSHLQAEGQKLLHDAQVAVAARDWANARLHLTKALATFSEETRFDVLKDSAQSLLQDVEQKLRVEADRQASQEKLKKFARLRDEAQFLGTLYTGMDLASNLKATRGAVQQGLAIYGISVDSATPPAFDPFLAEQQKTELLGDFNQLLLILAETQAQSATSTDGPAHLREALRLLQKALRFGAPSRAWHLRQARYLTLLGNKAEAQKEEKAAAQAPIVLVLDHFLVADELYRRGEFDAAIKEFNQVLQRKPAHFWAQYLNALCLLQLHRPAEARAQLSACLAQRADFVWLYLLRGFAQGELQAFDAAEADFQSALQLPLDEYSRYVLFVNRGVARVQQGRFEDAIADLKKATELKPSEYQAYVNLAQAYRRLNDLPKALEQLRRAVELEPSLAHLYRLRARLYLEMKQPALALADFDQAIQKENANSPFQADDQVERGKLLLQEQKYPEALASFDAALHLRSDHLLAQRLRAETLFHLGRYQEVVEAFDRYLETGKPLESVYRGRGLARAELGKYPGAIEDYTRALELHPTSAVQAYRGWAHLLCDAPKLALRDFQLAIDLDPKNGDAYNGRGFVEATQGRKREAIHDADEAVRQGPASARLLYNASRIYARCGSAYETRTIDLLRQAMTLLPGGQRAAFWATNVRSDTALQALRRSPRFLELEAQQSQRK